MIVRPEIDEREVPRNRCVALVQLAVADGEPAHNLARAGDAVLSAPAADLYVLPELFTTGYAHDTWPAAADEHAPQAIAAMRGWAVRRRAWVAGSIVARRDDGALVNRLLVLGPDGEPEAAYDKTHLFAPLREPEHLAPGESRVLATVADTPAALSICFDLRFPEMYRLDAEAGAELFVVSSAWPRARAEALRLFARARAAENQATLVLCNRTGAGADGTEFAGGSCVVGPDGIVLVDAGTREGVVICELDLAAAGRLRAHFPVLPLRRPGIDYEAEGGARRHLDPSVAALALEGMRARLMSPRGTPCADESVPTGPPMPLPGREQPRLPA